MALKVKTANNCQKIILSQLEKAGGHQYLSGSPSNTTTLKWDNELLAPPLSPSDVTLCHNLGPNLQVHWKFTTREFTIKGSCISLKSEIVNYLL
jgi:hypothetical protein